jgi:hypothetical protein
MKTTVKQLRRLVREEREYTLALNELFGIGEKPDFGKMLDIIMHDLYAINKKIEQAHKAAPDGTAKAIVAGLHSDLFNKIGEFRKYVVKLKSLVKQSQGTSVKHAATEGRRRG